MTEPARDQWAKWLLHRRHGDDPEQLQRVLEFLYPVRDRVLDNAEAAGFQEIHLELHAVAKPAEPRRWETVLHSSGNPKIPMLAEVMRDALTPKEAARYTAYRRPLIEQGGKMRRGAMAYLWAVKS